MPLLSIAPHLPFLETLAAYVVKKNDEFENALILLPSRRNCREFQNLLLEHSQKKGMILPKISPIGEIDEISLALDFAVAGKTFDIPPAINRMERLARLSKLIPLEFAVIKMAQSLCDLMDEFEREQISISQLENLVPDEYAKHWQLLLDLLKIVIREWPKELKKIGKLNPIARRNELVNQLISSWRATPPSYSIIAAGSTASIKSTSLLLAEIVKMPNGVVILPGISDNVDTDYMQAVDAAHPYYFIKKFCGDQFSIQSCINSSEQYNSEKTALFISALAPPKIIANWKNEKPELEKYTEAISIIETASEFEEARVTALICREALDDLNKKVIVVVEEHEQADLIATSLSMHGINIKPGHGVNILQTTQIAFMRLSLEYALNPNLINLLALLKYPFACVGCSRKLCIEAAREVDIEMRGYECKDFYKAIYLSNSISAEAKNIIEQAFRMLGQFSIFLEKENINFTDVLTAHIKLVENLASTHEFSGSQLLWKGEQGRSIAELLSQLLANSTQIGNVHRTVYASIFEGFLANEYYQHPYGSHPRIQILPAQEARLLSADVVIICGMNEGGFPSSIPSNQWLGRHMMEKIGLNLPEAKASRTAHDLLMLSHAKKLFLIRPLTIKGKLAEPSRYLARLKTYVMGHDKNAYGRMLNQKYNNILKQLELANTGNQEFISPIPPVSARPKELSVSDVEVLLKNPYAIYAKHILKLKPLEALAQMPDTRLFGILMHKILEKCSSIEVSSENYRTIASQILYEELGNDAHINLWQHRVNNLLEAFLEVQTNRVADIKIIKSEVPLSKSFEIAGGFVLLKTKIDRLEEFKEGNISIVDYKSYNPPSAGEINLAKAPQLTLMAMILEFLMHKKVDKIEYWNVSGRADLEAVSLQYSEELRAQTIAGFTSLMQHFIFSETAFTLPLANRPKFNAYEHLERLDEFA